MSEKIKYICYYNGNDAIVKRNCAPSAVSKIDYIVSALVDVGYDVELVSVSQVLEPQFCYYKSEQVNPTKGVNIRYLSSFGGLGVLAKIIKNIWQSINLLIFLLVNTKRGEKIIAYHSLGYGYVLMIAKYLKRFKLIYEVEEVYSDVKQTQGPQGRMKELKMINCADAYIFPTESLNDKFNTTNKPYVIIYGSYRYASRVSDKMNDGKIHVVYAGTFDIRKGGAAAAAAAAYLPINYHVHICGFGNESDTKHMVEVVEQTAKVSKATISYDGLKLGDEYLSFIQQCDIGLSTQDPTALFNDTSFPSKILSYMGNGLSVVSIAIPAIKRSSLAEYVTFYKEQSAQQIAKAIMATSVQNDNIELVKSLDRQFKYALSSLMNI